MATTEIDLTAFGVSAESPIQFDADGLLDKFAVQMNSLGEYSHDMAVLLPKHEMLSVAARLDTSAPVIANVDPAAAYLPQEPA
ncbi:MAG: hypothetical protein AB8B83_00780 [Bdellovibrionales bacterium]